MVVWSFVLIGSGLYIVYVFVLFVDTTQTLLIAFTISFIPHTNHNHTLFQTHPPSLSLLVLHQVRVRCCFVPIFVCISVHVVFYIVFLVVLVENLFSV